MRRAPLLWAEVNVGGVGESMEPEMAPVMVDMTLRDVRAGSLRFRGVEPLPEFLVFFYTKSKSQTRYKKSPYYLPFD